MSLFFKQKNLPGKVLFAPHIYERQIQCDRRLESIIHYLRNNYQNNQHIDNLIHLLREKNQAFTTLINRASNTFFAETNSFIHHFKTHHSKIETNKAKLRNEIKALEDFQTVFYDSIATIITKPELINDAKNYFKDADCYSRVGGKHGKRSFTVYDDLTEDAAEIGLIFLLIGTVLLATSSIIPVFLPIGIAMMAMSATLLAPSLFYFFIETLPNIISTWLEEKKLFDALEEVVAYRIEGAPSAIDLPFYPEVHRPIVTPDNLVDKTTSNEFSEDSDSKFHEFIPEPQQMVFN